ncbi:hypothetical protein GGX14DRAFT_374386 [Mycena pura]|uniref:Uncharacterized protein n=1 Tax=Mycena pura TaxID=153505 RepID=A0AAD6V2X5_9AGAR|nr:hypothetical protein GGX14DRAFT_374386 [Mycena pura]
MLLDIVDNLPRLRLSSSHFKIILWLLKECGVRNIPSYYSFRKMQASLRNLCGSTPQAYTSTVGNRFFVNDVRDSVARDFANPEVAKHLNFYPEETTGPVSEVWQAQRWKEFKPSELTPMFSRGLRQFYIDEVAELDTGEKVMPLAWVKYDGVLCGECVEVIPSVTGWHIGTECRSVPTSRIAYNYFDVVERIGDKFIWAVEAPQMPNLLRDLAEGDDLYVVMIPLWADDVSGNKSKQYNKHINMYMVNSNLPGQLLQQEYFVRFVSTSPNATSPEQFSAIKAQIQSTHTKPIRCFNAETQRNCCVILRVPSLPADNPQQSEEASHLGGNANLKCRRCMVGGCHEHTESDEGYHALHLVGIARTAAETKKTLLEQLDLAMYGVKAPIEKLQTATGVKDKVAQYWIDILIDRARNLKAESPGKTDEVIANELRVWLEEQPGDKVNPLLDIEGLDPNRDTPVEILHTILLGIVKYVWHMLYTSWSTQDQDLFVIRLQSTDLDGLTSPPIRAAYMIQYKNNLIGKHFKTLMQTMVFHMHGLVTVPPEMFPLVKSVSVLGPLLWAGEMDDTKQYTEDLTILTANVLDTFGDNDPARIINKMKLHLLPHLVEDAVRFGPPIRNSTEVFEGFNAIFRLCSVLSNHQAPSRDIAMKFASMDRLRHVLSGGYWKEGDTWVCAGSNVLAVLKSKPIIQRHLGWVSPKKTVPGQIRLEAKKKSPVLQWAETQASSSNFTDIFELAPVASKWYSGISLFAQSGDACKKGSWICAHDASKNILFGRLLEILSPESGVMGIAVLEHFMISERLHPNFDMPVLHRPDAAENQHVSVAASAVLFRFSAQHDCRIANCQPTASKAIVQERSETSRTISLLEHADDSHFIINMAALHNATLLRRVLPRALTVPRQLYPDRKAHHTERAATLRISQLTKRARTQEKRRNTLAQKAAQGRVAEELDLERSETESEDEGEAADQNKRPVTQKRKRTRQ